ncbi:hypothetical protein ACHAQA_002106 [Verticillium albo-atrum]
MSALRPNQREKAASKHGSSGIAAGLANGIANGLIDPTKLGKYPVLLSDTLLGRTQKDVFTSVRYNHKPQLSSDAAPALSRLKPETPGTKDNFELSFADDGGKYGYAGTRSTDQNQYVLYFDPAKKAFILDRVDSTFNMNLTRTPNNTDPESLRQQFEHLDTSPPVHDAPIDTPRASKPYKPSASRPTPKSAGPAKPSALKNNNSSSTASQPRKPAPEKKQAKAVEIALPPPPPVKEKRKPANLEEDEEDEDDDDFGLTIEYPDEPTKAREGHEFSPAFPAQKIAFRRFSEFLRDSEADDADGESDQEEERGLDGFKLPSPVNEGANQQQQPPQEQQQQQYEDSEDEEYDQMFEDVDRGHAQPPPQPQQMDDDDDMDLEAELEDALEQAANSGDAGEESEVSEED